MPTLEECLFQAFFELGNVDYLDNPSKAALRLCNKKIKAWIDVTVTACKVKHDALHALLRCDWRFLIEMELQGVRTAETSPSEILPFALISKFPTMEKLTINTNFQTLAFLPANIGELSHLRLFEMRSARSLKCLPPSFGQLTALERLTLPYGEFLTLEGLAPIKELKQLRHLIVGGRLLCGPLFPEWIRSCKFILLETLCLHDYNGDFHSSICTTFRHLTSLEIHHHGRDGLEVPESIDCLSLLQRFILRDCGSPVSLPESFSKLTSLQELEMVADMEGIAPLQHLTGLTGLTLHSEYNDRFENFPNVIWNLISLKALELNCGWHVRSLPEDAFHKLKNLMDLKCRGLRSLQKLPESIGDLSSLTNLQLISFNGLNSLPESIGNLVSLKYISIQNFENLSSLPDSIGNLMNLTSLLLSRVNELSKLPSTIGKLEALQRLWVMRSNLKELPETIGNLHALRELKITDCEKKLKILKIPDSFADLVFGTTSEDTTSLRTALTQVVFRRSTELVLTDRCMQALDLLEEHGMYKQINY